MARASSLIFLCLIAQGVALNRIAHEARLDSDTPLYKSECWKKRPVASLVQAEQAKVPGAGLEAFEPFSTVLKDGFYKVACVKDYMYNFGDKFGDGKFAYAVQDVSNVSIVHYGDHVFKEDRSPMTPTTCFEFCRTVPDMSFFGLTNGRTCYCTPYYQAMASDSSQCDVVCDGDNTQMCGGKTKSDIYEMHMCSSTQADLVSMVDQAKAFAAEMDALAKNATEASGVMQSSASRMKTIFGQAGDPGAADLMVKATQFAGELDHAAEAVTAVAEAMKAKIGEAEVLAGSEVSAQATAFGSSTSVTQAERIVEALDSHMASGADLMQELSKLLTLAVPPVSDSSSSSQYYPAMYFVDKEYSKVPSTCVGDAVAKPIASLDMDGCAFACNAQVQECVGFSYFDGPTPLCFLFSKLEKLQYYTGCDSPPAFLQNTRNKDAPFDSYCMAKFSKFDGTTLKPDPSHKCAICLEEASKADRCY